MSGQQPDLFRDAPAAPAPLSDRPRARRSDPRTSHIAAAQLARSGALSRQQRVVLRLVERYPGRTSIELAELSGGDLDRYQVARRLPELAPEFIRRSDTTVERNGRPSHVWFPLRQRP